MKSNTVLVELNPLRLDEKKQRILVLYDME